MNEDQLRTLVRAAVAKHLGRSAPPPASFPGPAALAPSHAATIIAAPHASHAVYLALVNTSEACVIEPDVPCTHCNYCKSHGH
jgi:hypothetical protein